MPGATSRLSMYLPGGGSTGVYTPDEVADIDKINQNMVVLDGAVGAPPFTSTTRPSVPFSGQVIRESDTGLSKVWVTALGQWLDLMPGGIPAVTTAQRDAIYPTPGSAALRVAQADRFPRVFNIDKGYEQQYFAQFDDSGIAATTPAKPVFGWGPAMHLGRVPLRPASIANTGGTAVLKGGMIEFAATTSFSANGVFTGDFSSYELDISITAASVAADIVARVRLAGVDETGVAAYGRNVLDGTTGSGVLQSYGTGNSAIIGRADTSGAYIRAEIGSPAIARRTFFQGTSMDSGGSQRRATAVHAVNTAYDGFSIIGGSGANMTGFIRIYGINDF